MKQVFVFAAMLLSGFILTNYAHAQNRSDGNVTGNFTGASPVQITNEVFRFKPGITTHYLAGALPNGSGSTAILWLKCSLHKSQN